MALTEPLPSDRLLLALQFYHRDQPQAMKVARLIADLEPRFKDNADFLFSARFDCPHDTETVKYVSKKFKTFTFTNRRRATGWPFGPNELWFGTMDHVYSMNEARRMPLYKAILTFEGDSVPTIPHWINRLSEGWDAARPAKIVGALQSSPGPHVNGNAMFSGDHKFLYWIARKVGGCSPHGGWDFVLASRFKKWGWADCPAMRSYWGMPTISRADIDNLVRQNVAFLHGVKDNSAIEHVWTKFIR